MSARSHAAHAELRGQLRFPVQIAAVVSGTATLRHEAEATDISTAGCRLMTPFTVTVGATVVLSFPGLAGIGASVRWCRADAIGVAFVRPLHAAVLDHLLREHRLPA